MKTPIRSSLLFLTVTSVFVVNLAWSQSSISGRYAVVESSSAYADAIARARADVEVLMEAGAPGVSIAVGVDDELVWAEGFGFADVENAVPVTTQTKFRVGSVSKTMTSIALGILYEEGMIDLDMPIQQYVPGFPVKEKGTVTTRLLASHRAGIRHYLPDMSDNYVQEHYDDVIDALEIFADDPLLAVPGDEYSYSSHGYNLLSAVLQEASGVEFLTLMRERVFSPLKLIETVADHTDYIVTGRAAPYALRDGRLINAPFVDNSYKWAGGGFISTPSDLVKFGFGVFHSGILKEETIDLLLSPPLLPNGTVAEQNYGLGWMTFSEEGPWVGHTGGSVGGNTLFTMNPNEGVVVAVVCNLSGCLGSNPDLRSIGNYFLE
ncbi:MAG: serine hydrolase [Gammaproteobacteria bacterium]|nr:serine hydrolase [Gammaproteobacteria bacterium]MDD9894789.1 serine hydrolase [Gammaproteobacteria bacterium]MDD9958274.1 serine hydrolase [Gammaproteobacteria bacterium]